MDDGRRFWFKLRQESGELHSCDRSSRVRSTVIEEDLLVLHDKCAGWENDVRYEALQFIFFLGNDERFFRVLDDLSGVVRIKKRGMDTEYLIPSGTVVGDI